MKQFLISSSVGSLLITVNFTFGRFPKLWVPLPDKFQATEEHPEMPLDHLGVSTIVSVLCDTV